MKSPTAQCEFCGCTDLQSCPEGCEWLPLYRAEGRWVCTSCAAGARRGAFADALEAYVDPPSPILLPGDPEYEATIMEMHSR